MNSDATLEAWRAAERAFRAQPPPEDGGGPWRPLLNADGVRVGYYRNAHAPGLLTRVRRGLARRLHLGEVFRKLSDLLR
jgi:hypothetical protein